MSKTRFPSLWNVAAWAVMLILALACSTDSPSSPRQDPPPPPGTGTPTFRVTITVNPGTLDAGGQRGSEIRISARRADNGAPPPDGSTALVRATLGSFGRSGSGVTETTVTLVGGDALLQFFAGGQGGTAVIQAEFQGAIGQGTINIRGQATFFLSFVEPPTGSPSGGDEVVIRGGGFVRPLRVTFNNVVARVLSNNAASIRVVTPALADEIPAGDTRPVNVSVTIRFNEEGQQSDTLASGFTYVPGGGPIGQPVVFSVDPPSGENEGGTRVTITGERFVAPVQVLFGSGSSPDTFQGVEATVESVTATRIVIFTPPAGGFGIDNRNQLVSILVRNIDSGFATIFRSAFQYLTPFRISGITPLESSATGGRLVSVFGSGFHNPLQVTIGSIGGSGSSREIEQEVVSVTPEEVVFRTTPSPIDSCPPDGVAKEGPVNIRIFDAGSPTPPGGGNPGPGTVVTSDQLFRFILALPEILDITPDRGRQSGGIAVTILGRDFQSPVRVTFVSKGQSFNAGIVGSTSTSINLTTPAVTDIAFDTEACDDNGDGTEGERFLETAFDVVVENLDTGCQTTIANGFIYIPTNRNCRNDQGPTPSPQCGDGLDNDGDMLIDLADPECSDPFDNDESM